MIIRFFKFTKLPQLVTAMIISFLIMLAFKNLNDLIINITDMLYQNQKRVRTNTRKLEFAIDEQSTLKRNNENTLEKLLNKLRETIYDLENNDDNFSLLSTTKATNIL